MRVLVVADDFTGACDTGVQFARPGRPCTVVFRPPQETLSVAVVDSESRHLSPRDAAERVRSALRDVDAATIVLKKIDSTFRGNVGSEVTAALDACPGRIALVIPAFPAGMRTTVGGHCRVNGVPLDQTEFARDPLSPVQSSAVAQLLGGALRTRLASDPNALRRAVDEAAPGDVVIVDAQTQSDIDDSLAVVAHELSRFVLVGSAGLGAAVGATLLGRPQIATPADGGTPPVTGTRASGVLGVVGSLSERSRRQVE
ncbi:MAG: four-carbon acid sugar kinase family protein, partial [Spirochaetaceae bacterium]